MGGGGFGGVSGLEKKRQYKAQSDEWDGKGRRDRYGMVYDEEELRKKHEKQGKYDSEKRERSRSRSPQREQREYDRSHSRREDGRRYDDRDRDRDRERYDSVRDGRGDRSDGSYRRR